MEPGARSPWPLAQSQATRAWEMDEDDERRRRGGCPAAHSWEYMVIYGGLGGRSSISCWTTYVIWQIISTTNH